MWKDSTKGYSCDFISKKGETLTVEIQKTAEVAVVKTPTGDRVFMGMRNNQVKIFNDMYFDEGNTNAIKAQMAKVCMKKVEVINKKRK
ncbi:MAG: hypothetical protein ACRCST_02695 [Turicibacter sp.]